MFIHLNLSYTTDCNTCVTYFLFKRKKKRNIYKCVSVNK